MLFIKQQSKINSVTNNIKSNNKLIIFLLFQYSLIKQRYYFFYNYSLSNSSGLLSSSDSLLFNALLDSSDERCSKFLLIKLSILFFSVHIDTILIMFDDDIFYL